jgi:hypothetical protein
MEWLALALWVVLLAVALPLGCGAFAAPPLGLQPPLAIAGVVLAVMFAANGAVGLAWAAFAVALAGVATLAAGAAQLIGDEETTDPAVGRDAVFAGVALPLYGTLAGVMLLAALIAHGSV